MELWKSSTLGGGTNPEIESKIEEILLRIDTHASETEYGMVKLSSASNITTINGFALPAKEKNASIDGTIANTINKINNNVTNVGNSVKNNLTYKDFTGDIASAIKSTLDNADFSQQKTKNFQISDNQNIEYITLIATDIGSGNYVGYAMHYGVTNSLWFIHYIKNNNRTLEYFEVNYTRKTVSG